MICKIGEEKIKNQKSSILSFLSGRKRKFRESESEEEHEQEEKDEFL